MHGGPVFEQVTDTSVDVRDTLSNQQFRIESSEPIVIEPTEYDSFPGPVTDAVLVEAEDVHISTPYSVVVRDESGDMDTILSFDGNSQQYTSEGRTAVLELQAAVKSHLRIDGPFECRHAPDGITIDLSQSRRTILGARPWQCYPEETITVTDSPEDLRDALSHFGSAILTTSPERSFPTLRGHPPRLESGETLDIPDSLSRPETGVTITVPSTTPALLTIAPLAYYLMATVEAGEQFTVRTADGFTYTPPQDTLSDAVKSVLTRCFYLDCLVRTEGLYPMDLQERHDFDAVSETDLSYQTLYDQPLARRLESYLQVDPEVATDVMPEWPVTAFVEPDTRAIEALPYLVYELADVRPANPPRYTGDDARRFALDAFSQGAKKARSTSLVFENRAEFVDVPGSDSQQTMWIGDGVPLNASKFLIEGYENHRVVSDRVSQPEDDSSASPGVEITVVCNDVSMTREPVDIERVCDPCDDFPMELSTHSGTSTDELRRILETGTDYLHFVGHATPSGLQCADGVLDISTVEENNAELFFLNACQSFQPGAQLVECGSSGGIVTYSDVSNRYALEVGGLVGRLLNAGFPVGVCLSIIRKTTPVGGQYTLVGNHAAKALQPDGVAPNLVRITEHPDGYELALTAYAAGPPEYTAGAAVTYALDAVDRYSLVPSTVTVAVEREQLTEFVSLSDTPVVYEGRLQSKTEFFEAIGHEPPSQ